MSQQDWSKFSMKIYIKATPQKVYDAWATRTGIESWFLRRGVFQRNDIVLQNNETVQQGDTYEWMWYGYPDSVAEHDQVLEANGKDRFSFGFSAAGTVTITITPVDEMTLLELTQSNIPTDNNGKFNFRIGCSSGWTFYLANLKSILEGGIDLRNKDPKYRGLE